MRIHWLEKNLGLGVSLKDRNQGKEIEIQAEEHWQKKDQILHFNYRIWWADLKNQLFMVQKWLMVSIFKF
jgi:hypothetical protein